MKKLIRVLALVLVVAMACLALASCGKTLSGTYSAEAGLGGLVGGKTSFTFSGSKVTLTVTGTLLGSTSTEEYEGKYEINEADDGTMTITFDFDDDNSDTDDFDGKTLSFSEDKDAGTIKIGLITYTKQK